MKNIVMAILAHPDDAEFLCAGTMIRLVQEHGWQGHIVTMTAGDCGSAEHDPQEIADIRRVEGQAAAKVVGMEYHCLEELDLRVQYGDRPLEKVCRLLNAIEPQIVITHSPEDYHLDHEQTSKIVRAATFAAPIPNFLHRPGHLESHAPLPSIPHLFYCDPLEGKDIFGNPVAAAFHIDIAKSITAKSQMLEQHESQRAWLRKHHGVDNLVQSMVDWSASRGQGCRVEYAEGFRQHLGHSYPQDNLLKALLDAV